MSDKRRFSGGGSGIKHDSPFPSKKQKSNVQYSKAKSLEAERRKLPIYEGKKIIMEHLKAHTTTIIIGETGSGKTTQLPQWLYETGITKKGVIGITQPRRVAAISVAQRVSEEMNVELGSLVGYTIRFEDKTSPNTKVKYLTDGMLLREAMLDKKLSKYSVIIIDEAHERTVDTDILFGLLKNVQSLRKDLKLIIMSATLDADLFANYFNASVLYVEGRQFPVETYFTTEPQLDYFDSTLSTILQIHIDFPMGDILVFLTGREEIINMEKALHERSQLLPLKHQTLNICPIYAALPSEEQMKAFALSPPNIRKVILATNIAETSITIPGIRYVIDPGFVKARSFDSKTGMETLKIIPVSRAAARQRAGRAGREAPGSCFRLYKEEDFYNNLRENPIPEIKRCNLSNEILQMKALGINDVNNFDYIEKPPQNLIIKALEELLLLGAIDDEGKLTELGVNMSKLPLSPIYSKTLLASRKYQCTEEVLSIISMLSVESDSIFYYPKGKKKEAEQSRRKFLSYEGDHFTLLNIYKAWSSNNQSKDWCFQNFLNGRALQKAKKY